MSIGEKFLRVVDVFAGYCQGCNEPKTVGRIAVAGWPFHGSVCSCCLVELADQVQRRANATTPSSAGLARVQAASGGSNGTNSAAEAWASSGGR